MDNDAKTILEARVSRGATLLDNEVPGWAAQIDLDLFDIAWPSYCAVGQSFPSYQEGCTQLGVIGNTHKQIFYGFDSPHLPMVRHERNPYDDSDVIYEYEDLNDAWRVEIGARL